MFKFNTQSLKPEPLASMIMPERERPEPTVLPKYESPLKLGARQREWLVKDYILERMKEVKREVGLLPGAQVESGKFMAIRLQNEDTYENNLDWRRAIVGSIFSEGHNFTVGTLRRYAKLISARVREELLGTRPFFAAMTNEGGDEELTKAVEAYIQDRINQSNVPIALRDALRMALIRNECVVKTTFRKQESRFYGPAKVLVDGRGQPLRSPFKNLLIYEMDDFWPDPTTKGISLLEKDPSFAMQDGQYQYRDFPRLEQTIVQYDGPDAKILDVRDFLCPLKFDTTEAADFNMHLFLENPARIRGAYAGYDVAEDYYRNFTKETGAKQPKRMHGEDEEHVSKVLGNMLLGEAYVRVDADGDGEEEEIFAVVDIENEALIFADYTGNHMSRRPFSVVPGIERVAGRWYGIGVFSKMEHNGLYIDAQFNRMNSKDSQDSHATFAIRAGVRQWKDNMPIRLGNPEVLEAMPGYNKQNPPLWREHLQTDAELTTELMNVMQQASDQEFAVISARDASASDLNQSRTATGIMSIDRDANVVAADTKFDHILGIEHVLENATELLLANMEPMTVQFSKNMQALMTLSREEIRNMKRKVTLLLTQTRSTEQLQTNEKAEATWLRYMRLSPWEQFWGRDFYVNQLKALRIDNADDRLPEVSKEDATAWLKAQSEKKEDKPVNKSIATKFPDLARSEQEQVLAAEGIRPAAPAEMAAKLKMDAELEAAKKPPQPPGGDKGPPKK